MMETGNALEGVKVVEFGGYAAGLHIGKVLGNFGAVVVHVESHDRPDGFRLEYPPYKEGRPGVDRGGCFAFFNDSKYGVTLNLKTPAGLALAHRLIDWADLVVENMRPGVMARLGLGYRDVCETHPDLVFLSTCNMGQSGPRAHTPGFGSQLSSLAGFCGTIGETDGPPMLLYGPYIDFIASGLGTAAVLAALDRSRRTGKGAELDLSQYETGLHFMAGALFDQDRTGAVATRRGNADTVAAPHGAYPCRDDRWLALSCRSDEEFQTLLRCLDLPELATDPRFVTGAARHVHLTELDGVITQACAMRDAGEAAEALQAAGITAHPVNTVADLFDDPQLEDYRNWRRRYHPVIGDQAYWFPGPALSATPGEVTRAAPLLGADNETVFKQLLGMKDREFDDQKARGTFE